MSKLYIFGIGGTGARVLRSFTMLMAAGVQLQADEIVPIIIDPDASNADLTRTVQLMNTYRDVRSQLSFTPENKSQFFRTDLGQVLTNYTLRIQDTDDRTFRQFISLPSMDKATQAVMRMLFSEKNLNSSMDVGFKGNPNIGSVVLNQIVNSADFESFANSFAQDDKIFIISSIFGGTGASGFPLLLKTLRKRDDRTKNIPNINLINTAEIGAITILPYFSLKTSDTSEIDSSTFISKTKSALAYYEKNISGNGGVNALYFLGDDITNTYDNHEGGTMQRNDAHIIEFLAATAIVDFCNKKHDKNTTVSKELGLNDLTGSSVNFASFTDKQHRALYNPLTSFILMANCLTRKFGYYSSQSFNANTDTKYFGDIYGSQFMDSLRQFFAEYLNWLREMKQNKRSLDLFNLESGDKPFDVVTGVRPRRVLSTKSDYDLVTDRLNAAVRHCNAKEMRDRFMETFHLATQRLIDEKLKP